MLARCRWLITKCSLSLQLYKNYNSKGVYYAPNQALQNGENGCVAASIK